MPDSDPYPNDNPQPRGFKAALIHLAGADPKVFVHLPPGEASEYAKMGFTVLIPFVLALTAGSFTLYTIQDAPKSWLGAILFGLIWALMILGMDVAIMSQLAKRAAPAPATVANGPRQAYAASRQQESPPPRTSSGTMRRIVLALMRIMIAATLGLVMSHCLVLAIFKGRVQSRVEEVRTVLRTAVEKEELPGVEKAQQQLFSAKRVDGLADRDQFLAAYNALQIELGAKTSTEAMRSDPAADTNIAATLKPYEDQIDQLNKTAEQSSSAALAKERDVDLMKRELLQAEEARRNELNGVPKTYIWYTPPFKAGMPVETSAIPGKGSRLEGINRAIKQGTSAMEEHKAELAKLQERAKKAEEEMRQAIEKKNAAKTTLLENNTSGIVKKIADYESAQKATEAKAREELSVTMKDLTAKNDKVKAQYETRMKPITGSSYDLLEQTEALHDLAFGHGDKGKGSKQLTILGLIVLILVCLMFIDLTPLMMKMMHPPGYYDQWAARPPSPAYQGSARGDYYRNPPPQGQSAFHSNPPPPPRRRPEI